MRKGIFVALMVVVFTLSIAGSAFAVWGNSGYTDWKTEASPSANPAFSSPHQGYTTTTRNCGVCHAVHNAASTGQVLLGDTVGNACNYCHVSLTGAYTQVYNSITGNFQTDFITNHSNSCTQCHAVHGANTVWAGQGSNWILRWDTTSSWVGTGKGGDPSAETSGSQMGVSKWCAGCHPYFFTSHNSKSHVMTAATAAFNAPGANYAGRVANVDSTYCMSCHNATVASGFPHYTSAAPRFLAQGVANAGATKVNNDGVCLYCHQWSSGASGVGKTF